MPSVTLPGGARLAFGEMGAGPPLVLVHGSPAEGRAWGRVARHLDGAFRLLTPDLPGYGGSDPLGANASTAAMSGAVVALIQTLAERAWLAGHSYGGNVALHAALASRERIEGLILFEPVFFRGLALAGEHAALSAAAGHFEDYVRRVEGGDLRAVSRMIEFWFGAGAFERLPPPVRDYLESAAPKNAAGVKAAFAESVSAEELAAFAPATVIAYGADSPPVVAAIARALAGLLPRAETHPIPGATHGMLDTHADAVAAFIRRCVARSSRRGQEG
jgi:pimeloyl-ACP methyl ester carboxylesterase